MIARVIKQLQLMLTAMAFLTRIPVPASLPFSAELLNRANRYFGLIGILVGAICALSYTLVAQFWSASIAIGLSMALSLRLTGVFHEDGLADTADGLGGGLDLPSKLTIMKDSCIGNYGASALIMALLLKFTLLAQVGWVATALIVAHALSRTMAASLIGALPYVREENSKSKPLASLQTRSDRWVLAAVALLVLLCLPPLLAVALLASLLVLRVLLIAWLQHQLQGFTGDTLGATQQISELTIYLVFALPWAQQQLGLYYGA